MADQEGKLTFRVPGPDAPGFLRRRRQGLVLMNTLTRNFQTVQEVDDVIGFLLDHVVTPEDKAQARAILEELSQDAYLEALGNLNGTKEAEAAEPPLPSSAS